MAAKRSVKSRKSRHPVPRARSQAHPIRPRGSGGRAVEPPTTVAVDIDPSPGALEGTLERIRGELKRWANKGRYTRVRFKFRGKPVLPDLPLAAVLAAEGLTFYWAGLLRLLVVNAAGRSLIDVELVNDSEKQLQRGKEALLTGDLEQALALFREAVEMDQDNAAAHLNVGVALKLKGDLRGARSALAKARDLDPAGAVGAEAERALSSLPYP